MFVWLFSANKASKRRSSLSSSTAVFVSKYQMPNFAVLFNRKIIYANVLNLHCYQYYKTDNSNVENKHLQSKEDDLHLQGR